MSMSRATQSEKVERLTAALDRARAERAAEQAAQQAAKELAADKARQANAANAARQKEKAAKCRPENRIVARECKSCGVEVPVSLAWLKLKRLAGAQRRPTYCRACSAIESADT